MHESAVARQRNRASGRDLTFKRSRDRRIWRFHPAVSEDSLAFEFPATPRAGNCFSIPPRQSPTFTRPSLTVKPPQISDSRPCRRCPKPFVFVPYQETPFHGSRSRRLRRHGHYSESQVMVEVVPIPFQPGAGGSSGRVPIGSPFPSRMRGMRPGRVRWTWPTFAPDALRRRSTHGPPCLFGWV
jgi:hypothetical protein